jgi:hypothetical protein
MSEILSQKLKLLDVIGADKNMKVHEALSVILGTGTQSNTYIINKALEDINTQITELESRNALVDVTGIYQSASGNKESFTGVASNINEYTNGMVLIFTIPQNNKGAVSINLNSLGAKDIKKYSAKGALVDLEADDFVRNHKYFLEYDGTQFVTLCENSVQELKALTAQISNHEKDAVKHITAEERTAWNGKSVVTKSETNGSVNVDGKPMVVYTHPSGTNPHNTTKEDVGLSNVANERQYSAQNPPPYPVVSVNGKTGAVVLKISQIENDLKFQTDGDVNSSITNAINALKNGVTVNLDTLKKIAAAINNDPNYHQTVSDELATKANKNLDNLDVGVLLEQGKTAGLLDKDTAGKTYETQAHASETYETKENAANVYETKEAVKTALADKADKTELPNKVFTATLSVEGWNLVSEGIYTQSITNENVTANDKLNLSPTTDSFLKEIMDAGIVGMVAKNDNGTLSVLLYGEKPKQEITISVEIVSTTQI